MKCNVGKVDKWIRMVLGLLIVFMGYYYGSWWGLIGLILVGTAMLTWCPIYKLFGLSSCELKKKEPNRTSSG